MHFGISFFATDTTPRPGDVGQCRRGAGFRVTVAPRAQPHPGVTANPLGRRSRRSSTARLLLAHVGQSCCARGGGRRDQADQARDRYHAGGPARPDLDRQGGGHARSPVRGRFIFGIGYGWNREEMESHGVAYGQRRALLREKVLMMKSLWADDEATYEGELMELEPSWAWPKPVQLPHPPIVLGGAAGPRTVSDIVEFRDGWIPLGRHPVEEGARAVREGLEAAGRSTATFEMTFFGAKATPEYVATVTELGFHRLLFAIPSAEPSEVMRALDERARFVESLAR